MAWQEELSQLDKAFREGRLTTDEYRVRRDQALAAASQQHSEQQGQDTTGETPRAEATQMISQSSLPPAQQQQPPRGSGSEATQIVSPVAGDADRTQAVPNWQAQQSPPPPGVGAAPVPPPPPQHPGSPPGGFPQQGPAWNAPQEDPAPPWGGDEFPPVAPSQDSDWGVDQGPELFEKAESKGGAAGKIIAAVLAVLVIGGLAFGGWWMWGRDASTAENGPEQTAQTTAQTEPTDQTTEPTQQNENLPMAALEGSPEEKGDVKTFADVPDLEYLTEAELEAYEDAGAGDAVFQSVWLAGSDGTKTILLLTEAEDSDAAKAAAEQLTELQEGYGAEVVDGPPGVLVTEYDREDDDYGHIRAHYASGNVIVRIEVLNLEGGSDAAQAPFSQVLEDQLDLLPADS